MLYILFCLIFSTLCAVEDNDPIVVRLSTESSLMPLFVGKLEDSQSGFDAGYLQKLEQILRFDMGHNGMTYNVRATPSLIALDKKTSFDQLGDLSTWNDHHVYFVIKARVKDKKLGAKIVMVNSHTAKMVDGLALTGNLSEDRRQIHQLADMVHKTLFDQDGIATSKLIYTIKTQNAAKKWISEVWEADYDGGNARQITKGSNYCVTPTYAPPKPGYESQTVFFVSYEIGQPKIYYASTQDGVPHRFSLLKGNQLMPAISRQRDQIAFISDITGNPDLFVQSINLETGEHEKPRQAFTSRLSTQGTPTFSPDGKQLAFVSNKDGSPRIYVIDVPKAGTRLQDVKPRLITKQNRENTAPCWSPDGKKITYSGMTNGTRQIWVYDIENGEERQLTQGAGNKENPTWAPNSLHIVFNSTGHDLTDLYLINLNQTDTVKITQGPGEKRFPSWASR